MEHGLQNKVEFLIKSTFARKVNVMEENKIT